MNRYMAFVADLQLQAIPVTQENVTLFVAYLGTQKLSTSTIEAYLSALRYLTISQDPSCLNPSFHTPHLKVLLKGIGRANSAQGTPRVRLPITAGIMRRIKQALQIESFLPDIYTRSSLWAACCVGFFGFLRCAEFLIPDDVDFNPDLHLTVSDIYLDTSADTWKFFLRIKASKTDQSREGTTIVLGGTGLDLCPVAALLEYAQLRGSNPGPLFQLLSGQPMH